MPLESKSSEHSISLPLVGKEEERPDLPLAINVVAKYWGEDLAGGSGRPAGSQGTSLIRGIELAEQRGLVSFVYKGSLKDLKKRIDQGIPPIVIIPGIQGIVQHALVVCGYDDDERRILTYVPEPDTVGAIPEARFADDWGQDEATAIVIVPSDMAGIMKGEDLQFKESNRLCFEAEWLRQQNRDEAAIEKLRQATAIDPANAQAWCLLGGMYNERGDTNALSCYERAVALNPRYYLAFRGLGNYYLKAGDYSLAESYYSKALAINSGRFGPIYKNRAIARMRIGNNAGAKEDLLKYLEQTPGAQDRSSIEDAIAQL